MKRELLKQPPSAYAVVALMGYREAFERFAGSIQAAALCDADREHLMRCGTCASPLSRTGSVHLASTNVEDPAAEDEVDPPIAVGLCRRCARRLTRRRQPMRLKPELLRAWGLVD